MVLPDLALPWEEWNLQMKIPQQTLFLTTRGSEAARPRRRDLWGQVSDRGQHQPVCCSSHGLGGQAHLGSPANDSVFVSCSGFTRPSKSCLQQDRESAF